MEAWGRQSAGCSVTNEEQVPCRLASSSGSAIVPCFTLNDLMTAPSSHIVGYNGFGEGIKRARCTFSFFKQS